MASPTLTRFAAASRLFLGNAGTLIPLTLLAHGPSFALQLGTDRPSTPRLLLAGLLDWTVAFTLSALLARTVGGQRDLFGAWTALRPNAARLLGTAFLSALAVMAGSLLFVVPGLLAVALLGPAAAIAGHEGAAPTEAIERSASVIRAEFPTLGVPLLAGVLASSLVPIALIAVVGDRVESSVTILALSLVNALITAWVSCLVASVAASIGPRQDGRLL